MTSTGVSSRRSRRWSSTHASLYHRNSAHWIAFVDIDEFVLLSRTFISMAALLASQAPSVGALLMRGDAMLSIANTDPSRLFTGS